MAKQKTAVLIVNVGTPNSPSTPDVRRYLREFLMDGRVIDIKPVNRWFLINLIIAPFRAPKSAKLYQELWDEKGSPLKYLGEASAVLLEKALGEEEYFVRLAMRYQNPSIANVLKEIKAENPKKIIVLPLFPQYASASTGTVNQEVMRLVGQWETIPELQFIDSFTNHPQFIAAFKAVATPYLEHNHDHVLFSYHGLPERQIQKGSHNGYCQLSDKCCASYNANNRLCYRAQCFETSRQLAKSLGLAEGEYSTAFQSRLGKTPWIKPYTEVTIKELVQQGKKRIVTLVPSFVNDCLETTVEVGREYKEVFEEEGGEDWQFVPSLNTQPEWIECMRQLVMERS